MPRPTPPDLSVVAATRLESLDDRQLQRWVSAAIFCKQDATLSWFSRFRWRRQFQRLAAERMNRMMVAIRMPEGPAVCERCTTRPPTNDVVYGSGSEQRFAYFCDECYKHEPPGRFVRRRVRRRQSTTAAHSCDDSST